MDRKKAKKQRKLVASLAVLSLSVSLLAGCGSTKEDDTKAGAANASNNAASANASNSSTASSSNATDATAPVDEHYDVTVSTYDIAKAMTDPQSDALLQKVQKDTNLTFKPLGVTWNDYNEKYKLWAASGQLPDMFLYEMTNGPTVSQWIKQGLVREIPESLYGKYPNLNKVLNLPDAQSTKVDGKFYGIPRLSKNSSDEWALERGFIVRKDWMEKLGIQTPKTFDEYLAMFKAFADNDPDGNGKKDTIGMTTNFLDVLNTTVKLGSAVPNLGGWMQEDGKWIPAIASKGMSDYVTKYRKLYEEGALDKDFALLKAGDGGDKFAQGNVGALNIQISDASLKGMKDKWDKFPHNKSFEDSIAILPAWDAPDGSNYRFYGSTFYTEIYFNNKVDDKKLDSLLKFIDFELSDQGRDLFTYGIEGTDFKKENGKVENLKPLAYPSTGMFFMLNGLGWGMNTAKEYKQAVVPAPLIDMSAQMYDNLLKNSKPIPMNFDIENLATPAKVKVAGINWSDAVVKTVLGKDDPVKMWQDQYASFDQQAINDAIKEVNDAAAQKGIK